jgi:phage terminase small subunit
MPELKNPKHEKFAQGIVSGLSATKAYIFAGYEGRGAAGSADRLQKNAEVCVRIAELRAEIAQPIST